MHGNGGSIGDESRRRPLVQYTRERLFVEFPQWAVELPPGVGPDVPARMLDSVLDRAAVPLPGVTPLSMGQEFFFRSRRQGLEWRLDVQGHSTQIARPAKLVLDALQLAARIENGVLQWHGPVRFVVGELGHLGDEWARNHLAKKHDARASFTAGAATNIEAKVHFLEVLMEERGQRQDVRVEKKKSDEADEVSASVIVQLHPDRQVRPQDGWIDLVIEHAEVTPVGGQE